MSNEKAGKDNVKKLNLNIWIDEKLERMHTSKVFQQNQWVESWALWQVFIFQVVRAFLSVQFDAILLINVVVTKTAQLTSTIEINVSTADWKSVSRWEWKEKVSDWYFKNSKRPTLIKHILLKSPPN